MLLRPLCAERVGARVLANDGGEPVEVHDFRKITNPSRRIYRIYLQFIKKNRKIT